MPEPRPLRSVFTSSSISPNLGLWPDHLNYPTLGEKLVIITTVRESIGEDYFAWRQQLIGRPFFLAQTIDIGSFRPLGRRETVFPATHSDARSFLVNLRSTPCAVEFTVHEVSEAPRLYEAWLGISRSDYSEGLRILGEEDPSTKDNEEVITTKRKRSAIKRFRGLWREEYRDQFANVSENVFMRVEERRMSSRRGGPDILISLCDANGEPFASLLEFNAGEGWGTGCVYSFSHIDSARCPFSLTEENHLEIEPF